MGTITGGRNEGANGGGENEGVNGEMRARRQE